MSTLSTLTQFYSLKEYQIVQNACVLKILSQDTCIGDSLGYNSRFACKLQPHSQSSSPDIVFEEGPGNKTLSTSQPWYQIVDIEASSSVVFFSLFGLCSQFLAALLLPCKHKPKSIKRGRSGNEANIENDGQSALDEEVYCSVALTHLCLVERFHFCNGFLGLSLEPSVVQVLV